MSGVMNPLDTLLGVVTRRRSSSRALMFPSLLATKPRVYRRRPTSTMSARICSSALVLTARRNSVSLCRCGSSSPRSIFASAFFGAEVVSSIRDRRIGRHVGPANGIAYKFHGTRFPRRGCPARPGGDGDHAADHPPYGSNDEQKDDEFKQRAQHGDPLSRVVLLLNANRPAAARPVRVRVPERQQSPAAPAARLAPLECPAQAAQPVATLRLHPAGHAFRTRARCLC